MKKNIAVVGCGYWGKNLIRNFSELGVLHSVSDINKKTANNYANQFKVKYLTFDKIINDENIKGVVLTVPANLHATMAIKAMNKGKHVFVEKPLALNISDAKLMIDVAKKNKVQLMVGHLLHYHPIFNEIKKLVNDGQIGKINYIESTRLSFGKFRNEEDVIWSFAPHDISMILSLAKEKPSFVKCFSKSIIKKNHADIANIYMKFPSGLNSNISISWMNHVKESKLILTGSFAVLVFDDTKKWNEKLSYYSYSLEGSKKSLKLEKLNEKFIKIPEEEPLRNECQHFIKVIENNIKPHTDGIEGMKVLKVLSSISKLKKENQN